MCALIALVCGFAQAADGELYKWVDKDGNVHYTDMPPPKANASKLKRTRDPTPAAAVAPKSYVEQEIDFRKRRTAADESTKEQQQKQAEQEQVRRACADSVGRTRTLQEGGRFFHTNEKGERIYYDDKMRTAEIAKEKKFQATNCKG